MFKQTSTCRLIGLTIMAGIVTASAAWHARADEGHNHNHAGHNHGHHKAHYGGQVCQTKSYCFEVVYLPQETRIYLFDHMQRRLSMQGVQGKAALQFRSHDRVHQLSARYVPARRKGDHDYLAVTVNVSRIRDGDLEVKFMLNNLPNSAEPRASFSQMFALAKTASLQG